MSDPARKFLEHGVTLAQEQIRATVRSRYFPEIWYILENWFQTVKGRQALEVGYGLGLVGPALAKSGWQVAVMDPQTRALSELSERFAKQGLHGEFVQSELGNLPFADRSMDAVVAINSLEFSPNQLATLREIGRVLRPQGRAVIVTFNRHGPWGLQKIAEVAVKSGRRQANRLLTKNEFSSLLTAANLHAAKILDRAAYLPVALPFKVKLPLAGAYVALVQNHQAGGGGKDKDPPIKDPSAKDSKSGAPSQPGRQSNP